MIPWVSVIEIVKILPDFRSGDGLHELRLASYERHPPQHTPRCDSSQAYGEKRQGEPELSRIQNGSILLAYCEEMRLWVLPNLPGSAWL